MRARANASEMKETCIPDTLSTTCFLILDWSINFKKTVRDFVKEEFELGSKLSFYNIDAGSSRKTCSARNRCVR